MRNWPWPQGRTTYLNFDNIKLISNSLINLNGVVLAPRQPDPLKARLVADTGLPFAAPATHKVWRNYDKTFECALLATNPDNILTITDLCRRLAVAATNPIDVDEYLSFLLPRFYTPFPSFTGYNTTVRQEFPFCAVLKYLLAVFERDGQNSIGLDDIYSVVVGNSCDGTEDLIFYKGLPQTGHQVTGDAHRQIRESLIFVSQSSFLKWHRNRLYLDILAGDTESVAAFRKMLDPKHFSRRPNAAAEILALGTGFSNNSAVTITARQTPSDVIFTEGYRVRATHLRIERSQYLRKVYFDTLRKPYTCDMCSLNFTQKYPWTENLLEIHHLLPLSSSLVVTTSGTSLQDVVALCPNCHRSVHVYYKQWLNRNSLQDFRSKREAKDIYQKVKGLVVP